MGRAGRGAARSNPAGLHRVAGDRGVDFVEEIRVFGANPVTGERGQATTRLELAASAIAFSYEHQIRVVEP